jgi:hypothetical protein
MVKTAFMDLDRGSRDGYVFYFILFYFIFYFLFFKKKYKYRAQRRRRTPLSQRPIFFSYALRSVGPYLVLPTSAALPFLPRNHPELSVPWTRTSLLNTATYVASSEFVSQVEWLKSSNQSDLVLASADSEDPSTPSSRATCAVVGTVSPNRLFLEPHGNYNPNFEKSSLETSKAQFQLVAPTVHPKFEGDFNHGIKNMETIQNMACKDGPGAEHFIIMDGGKKNLKFSWPLFEKRVCRYF